MVLGALALGLGVGSSILSNTAAKKAANKQAALARAQAARIRKQAGQTRARMERELDSLRTLRDLDLPAFQQASQQAYLNASKAAERVARSRTMGRMGDEVREAVFGGQFDQYVGGKMQGLQRHADLTQRIFQGASQIEQMTLAAENQASQISYGGQSQAISTEAAAGDPLANILGVTAQALAQFDSADKAASKAEEGKGEDLMKQMLMSEIPVEDLLAKQGKVGEFMQSKGFEGYTPQEFHSAFFPKGGK